MSLNCPQPRLELTSHLSRVQMTYLLRPSGLTWGLASPRRPLRSDFAQSLSLAFYLRYVNRKITSLTIIDIMNGTRSRPPFSRSGNDRVEEKERLTREWRANSWERLNPQMHAAQKILADFQVDDTIDKNWFLELLDSRWISQLFEGFEKGVAIPNELREEMELLYRMEHETRLRIEKEVEDTGFKHQHSRSSTMILQRSTLEMCVSYMKSLIHIYILNNCNVELKGRLCRFMGMNTQLRSGDLICLQSL